VVVAEGSPKMALQGAPGVGTSLWERGKREGAATVLTDGDFGWRGG
jgi:hypothetical protein